MIQSGVEEAVSAQLGGRTMVDQLNETLARRTQELKAAKDKIATISAELTAEREKRAAELTAERERWAAERDHLQTVASSWKSQFEGVNSAYLGLLKEVHADISTAAGSSIHRSHSTPQRPARPTCSSTPVDSMVMSPLALSATFDDSIQTLPQHENVPLCEFGPADHARILHQSFNRVDRYGSLLFRHIISEGDYNAWKKTTNWDGSRGKRELPRNVKDFITSTVQRKFPDCGAIGLKKCVDRINEYLRRPRRSLQNTFCPE